MVCSVSILGSKSDTNHMGKSLSNSKHQSILENSVILLLFWIGLTKKILLVANAKKTISMFPPFPLQFRADQILDCCPQKSKGSCSVKIMNSALIKYWLSKQCTKKRGQEKTAFTEAII